MTDRGTVHRVSAGPYMLELPTNGVAILFEDGRQLPGGVGYLDALVQFAGEVIRLRSMLDTIRRDPEITDPRDPYKRPDIVPELDRWLAVYNFAGLIDVAVIQRARDEIVALRASLERHDRLVITAIVAATPAIRAEALEEAAQLAHANGFGETAAAIRALKEK